jgi:hypothetical protein
METVRDFGSGDQLTTERIVSWVKAVQELQRVALLVIRPPLWRDGNTLGAVIPALSGIVGKIVATGPGSAPDYSTAQYWVQIENCSSNDSTGATPLTFADASWTPPPPVILTATNLSEFIANTHTLSAGAIVKLHTLIDAGGNVQYVFTMGGSGGTSQTPIKISGGASGTYSGVEQTWSGSAWSDKTGATSVTLVNLCETTGGHTSPVDAGAIVLATQVVGTYFFNWPTNAKYKV